MKRLARWLFLRYWSDEIIEANAIVWRKDSYAERNGGIRRENAARESIGAAEVLRSLGFLQKRGDGF